MTAEAITAVTNVIGLLGDDFEPAIVDLQIGADGRIAEIGTAGSGQRPRGAEGVLDGSGLIAFPGMVDCHDHLRNLTPGLAIGEGLKLDDRLRANWTIQGSMGPAEYRLGALLGMVQRLKTGVTTVVDHCYTYHAPELDEAALDGYEVSGGRWLYARGIMTRPYEPVCEDWATAERRIRALVAGGRLPPERLFVAPVSIRQATADDFRRCRALADQLGCGLYTHVSETAGEREVWERECGDTPIRALDAFGFLTPRTVLVHCVLLDDGEIELLAERGCHVIHCPTNHMKLAKGFTRVPDLLAAGVNVAMGLDMMLDMLVEMRTELGMHAAHRLDPNAVTKVQAMRMATANGARALGLGDRLGVLKAGLAADIVLVEADGLMQAPLIDPVYALLYTASHRSVRHVLVDGRLVVRDGRSTIVDEAALKREVEEVVAAYLRRIGFEPGPWLRADRSPPGASEG